MTTAEEKKEAFVFYETFIESVKELEPADQYRFLCAIINYGIYGAEPEFVGLEKALWIQIRNAIDQSKSRRKSAQTNGAKGGRPRTEESVIGGEFSDEEPAEEEYEDYIEDNEEVIDIDEIDEQPENITERPFENKEEENQKESNKTEKNQTKPKITENNPIKPNETENNPTETQKNLNGNGNGNGDGDGKGNGNENGKAAAAVRDIFTDTGGGTQPEEITPNNVYSWLKQSGDGFVFDRDFYAQAALFFNERKAAAAAAFEYIKSLAEAAKKRDNPSGYIYRIILKPEVWERFMARPKEEPKDLWRCPCCGRVYSGSAAYCQTCGLSPRSSEVDITIAQKRRELTPQEFAVWEQQRIDDRRKAAAEARKNLFGE